jgi:hypothetical protein
MPDDKSRWGAAQDRSGGFADGLSGLAMASALAVAVALAARSQARRRRPEPLPAYP